MKIRTGALKILELTKSQEKKLLQLCEQFFPEWDDNHIRNSTTSWSDDDTKVVYFGKAEDENTTIVGFNIHWYQLCLTELAYRIFIAKAKLRGKGSVDSKHYVGTMYYWKADYNSYLQDIVYQSIHPVEYLFNFVKECKKNKYFKNATKE